MSLVPIITVICIVIISLLVTKIAAAMLVNTGMSDYTAKFQSRSAFTGCGFTTSESELITTHPYRRKVVATLMLVGHAGVITVLASLILTFVNKDETGLPWYYSVGILGVGIIIIALLASNNKINNYLTRQVNWFMVKFTRLHVREYSSLYKLADGYNMCGFFVEETSWLVGQPVSTSAIKSADILVLGIEQPDGTYLGTVTPDTVIKKNDLLILYGDEVKIAGLKTQKLKTTS
ncbi:MAG: TrkA C-terminal domain-containing protein [Bacteroidales bacterium]|nr:TrkA C-terminal domain-containing protein [Bacteroidales bacterium]